MLLKCGLRPQPKTSYEAAVDSREFFQKCQDREKLFSFRQKVGPERLYCGRHHIWGQVHALLASVGSGPGVATPLQGEHDMPCTVLELAIHHSLVCNLLPPVAIFRGGKQRFEAARSKEDWLMQQTVHQTVSTFQEACSEAGCSSGLSLFSASRLCRAPSLRCMGGMTSQGSRFDLFCQKFTISLTFWRQLVIQAS